MRGSGAPISRGAGLLPCCRLPPSHTGPCNPRPILPRRRVLWFVPTTVCLGSCALTDIKCGLLCAETLMDAREVARRVGKGGNGLERTCDMTEVVAAVDGSHSTVRYAKKSPISPIKSPILPPKGYPQGIPTHAFAALRYASRPKKDRVFNPSVQPYSIRNRPAPILCGAFFFYSK